MSFSARYLPAILLAILTVSTSLFAQSTTKQTPKVPHGSVSGRVTIKDKGAPGVAVGLRKGEINAIAEPFQRAITDQDGVYRFNNLAPGNYTITASAPAYVPTSVREQRLKTVLVGEDESVEDINFTLVRGGVITGRVTDADGRAVIDQQVQVLQATLFEQRNRELAVYPSGVAQTDDRGVYRVFGLSAGKYKVAVGRNDDERNSSYNQVRSTSYRQVFHPDAIEPSKATVIEVSEGSESANVDITLGRVIQTFSASAVAIDKDKGFPIVNMRFGVQRVVGQRIENVSSSATSNSRGELVLEGLIPGKYTIQLFPIPGQELRADPTTFEITDHDVNGLTVRVGRGASVSGVVVLQNYEKAAFEKLVQLQIRGYSISGTGAVAFGSSAISKIGADGSFRLAPFAGGRLNLIFASPPNPFPPKGFNIERIERDGVVVPRGMEIKEGEQVTGVRVIVSYGTATIRGVVKLENGSAPEGARIFVRLTRAGEPASSTFRPSTVDERGHFLIEGVPAGSYDIIAFITGAFAPGRQTKQSITVTDGATMDLVMTIDLQAPHTNP